MNDSQVAQQREDRGLERGTLVGKIQAFQEMLKQPVTPAKELRALPEQNLESLLAPLRTQWLANGH